MLMGFRILKPSRRHACLLHLLWHVFQSERRRQRDGGLVEVNTYDGYEELRSRAASGHKGSTCYVLAELETLKETNKTMRLGIPHQLPHNP